MKKLKIKVLHLFCVTLILSSCTKDLDVLPKGDKLFLAEDFYRQPGAYKQGLAGVYGNLSLTGTDGPTSSFLVGIDAGTSQFGRCLWYLQDLTTDEVVWSYEADPGTRDLQRNIWTAANPILLGMFSRTMAEVSFANEYLKQTSQSKLDSRGVKDPTLLNEISLYRKEARVLRAYAYYNLMDLFGKAPFVTENDELNTKGPQYNRAQLFNFIESELLAVIPDLKAPRTNEYGRLDQAMARMILAKIYLNAEVYIGTNRYADCATQCSAIIGGGYTLNPLYLNNFKADNNTSSEMIFTLQSDGNLTQNYGPTTVFCNGSVGSIEQNGISLGVSEGGWGGALRLRKEFVDIFNNSTSFATDTRNKIFAGTRSPIITDITNKDQGYILKKFSNISSTGVAGSNNTFVDTDFPLFRLADVYLMYAECAAKGGASVATAQTYVNALRTRANSGSVSANVAFSTMNSTDQLSYLLDERARELHWESHRRQDLIRFNKYTNGYNWAWKGNATNGIPLEPNFKLFPIPENSLRANTNLTQNPGY